MTYFASPDSQDCSNGCSGSTTLIFFVITNSVWYNTDSFATKVGSEYMYFTKLIAIENCYFC